MQAMAIAMIAQFILTHYLMNAVHDAAGDLSDSCTDTTPLLRYVAIVYFISLVIQDLQACRTEASPHCIAPRLAAAGAP